MFRLIFCKLKHSTNVSGLKPFVFLLCNLLIVVSGCSSQPVQRHQPMLDAVQQNGDYSVFVTAMQQSGLWDSILQEEEITLFIPDNASLEKEGSRFLLETVLVASGNEQRLIETLSQHIIPGKFDPGSEETTLEVLRTYKGDCIGFNAALQKVGLGSTVLETVVSGNATIIRVDRMISERWDNDGNCSQFS